ncbi:metal-dependent hydrolase [Paenibacillus sp. MBLB4367]|uniref:metal-dependent hydrolase n=1 Tax=Paenibacillus sp. MBLB4367 TaxID=3384767 RepID=UPI003907F2F7
MIFLFFHVLTHLVGGVLPTIFLVRKYNIKGTGNLLLVFLGALAGMLPDIYGGRDVSPWSHSIIFAPLMVIPLAIIAKLLQKCIPFLFLLLALTLSLLIGHLLFDLLGHEVPLFYPIINGNYSLDMILLGDPWIPIPLVIGAILYWSRKINSRFVIIPLIFCLLYLGVRFSTKPLVEQYVKDNYLLSKEAVVHVYPPGENMIHPLNLFDWFQWSYDLIDIQRVVRANIPLIGDYSKGVNVNYFYDKPSKIMTESGVSYRKPKEGEKVSQVIKELKDTNGTPILISKASGENFVFHFIDGWSELTGLQRDYFLKENGL